jgi:hypothetical protein
MPRKPVRVRKPETPEARIRKLERQRAAYARRKAGTPVRARSMSLESGTRRPRPSERPPCGTCTGSGCQDTLTYDCPDCAGTGLLTHAQALAHYDLKRQLTTRAKGWLIT